MAARAYGVIGLGARVAKIKQVCSVTTRGGERGRERKRDRGERGERERRREGSDRQAPLRTETTGGELAPLSLHTPTAGNGEGRKKKKGDREREQPEKRRKEEREEEKEAESWSLRQ